MTSQLKVFFLSMSKNVLFLIKNLLFFPKKKSLKKTLLFQVPSITGNKPNEADPFLKLSPSISLPLICVKANKI